MKDVIIVGAGGHAKVIADIVLKSGDSIKGFFDNSGRTEFLGYPILGTEDVYEKYLDCYFVIGIGNANVRKKMTNKMTKAKWYTAIHPQAIISSIGCEIGEGTVVMANAVINSCAKVGKHCIINTLSVVEHDNVICDYVHISVGAKVAGSVTIGAKTWVGVGATVSNNITICNDCMIGAGAVVVEDINESGTYVGVPTIKIKWYDINYIY